MDVDLAPWLVVGAVLFAALAGWWLRDSLGDD